jgi:tetratricopeptide (TPR) repeat protein
MFKAVLLAAWLLALTGCAMPQSRDLLRAPGALPARTELRATPFFPQLEYQCGPAALATVLVQSGVTVTPDALAPQVYLPGREGSLATELIAAPRRHGRVAWKIAPQMRALLTQIAFGQPVLVLQNRAFAFAPLWHYAVAVGFDLERQEIVLRSGKTEREIMSFDVFERTWLRAEGWAIVIGLPDAVPDFVTLPQAMNQALAFERARQSASAKVLYQAIVARWPDHDPARFGLANMSYATGEGEAAERLWRQLINAPQSSLPVFYNLAQYLLENSRFTEARELIKTARMRWPNDQRLHGLEQKLPAL